MLGPTAQVQNQFVYLILEYGSSVPAVWNDYIAYVDLLCSKYGILLALNTLNKLYLFAYAYLRYELNCNHLSVESMCNDQRYRK